MWVLWNNAVAKKIRRSRDLVLLFFILWMDPDHASRRQQN